MNKLREKARSLLFLNQQKLLFRELYEFEKDALISIHYMSDDEILKAGSRIDEIISIFDSFDSNIEIVKPIPIKYERFCFCCKKPMEPSIPRSDWDDNSAVQLSPPLDGIFFDSYGNYGSTVWDPVFGERSLNIIICDKCVLENEKYVLEVTKKTREISKVSLWRNE